MRRRAIAFICIVMIASSINLFADDIGSVDIHLKEGVLTMEALEDRVEASYPTDIPNEVFSRSFRKVLKDVLGATPELEIIYPADGNAIVKYPAEVDLSYIPKLLDEMSLKLGSYIDELMVLQNQDTASAVNLAIDKTVVIPDAVASEEHVESPDGSPADNQTESSSTGNQRPIFDSLKKLNNDDSFIHFNLMDHGINIGLVSGLRLDQNGVFCFWFGPSINWKSNSVALKYQTGEVFKADSFFTIYQSLVQHLHSLHLVDEDLGYVIHADRTTDYSFVSPLFRSYSHMLATKPDLSATYSQSFRYFDLNAFIEDLEMTDFGQGFSNYSGVRISSRQLIERITVGFSLVDGISKSGDGMKINLYDNFDVDVVMNDYIDLHAFVLSNFMDLTQLSVGVSADLSLDFFDASAEISYHNSCYNANLINDTPVHFVDRRGRVLEFEFGTAVDLDILKVSGSFNLPFEIGDSFGLFRRTASLRHSIENGMLDEVSADYLDLCATLDFGWCHFKGGLNTVGLLGQVVDSFSGIFHGSMTFGEIIKALFCPDLGTLYVQADARIDIADVFTRLELSKNADGRYGISCVIGSNLSLE